MFRVRDFVAVTGPFLKKIIVASSITRWFRRATLDDELAVPTAER